MKTTSGLSLNDVQYVGPIIQNELFAILLRFRKFRYVMTADISKMYRMILVNESDRSLQTIFWRYKPTDDLKCYQLNTVTYGTASAPFLAIRCLNQLAEEHKMLYPLACHTIKTDFYVDDLLTGAASKDEILQLQREISNILASGGFQLRKWLTNDVSLFNQFTINETLESSVQLIGDHDVSKTLGIFGTQSPTVYSTLRQN